VTRVARKLDACLPESRLADPRLAIEDERRRQRATDERLERRQLSLAADDLPAHDGHPAFDGRSTGTWL
jgi:hypothetical protein